MQIERKEYMAVEAYLQAAAVNGKKFSFGEPDLTKPVVITRKSDRLYDLSIKYTDKSGMQHGAWLPLGAIREQTVWTSSEIANMTNHPTMTMTGDWSGVRDSDEDNIWAIFGLHVILKGKG